MKASEARKTAIEVSNSAQTEEYNEIIECIIRYCKQGDLSIHYYDRISYAVRERLKDDGYTFSDEQDNQREGYSIKISW